MRALSFSLIGCLVLVAFVVADEEVDIVATDPGACTKENEEFQACGTRCPVTCANHLDKTPRACTMECVVGCLCKTGFVKNDEGNCVKEEDCPNHPTGGEHHEDNEHHEKHEHHEEHEHHEGKEGEHEHHEEKEGEHEHHEEKEEHEHHD
uniref:Putative til domain protein n=1 Tax=Xenopsylla cheopis TaxID=163159 RepID=A0A6M2DUT8_XENCH